jgi:hypothetical protein
MSPPFEEDVRNILARALLPQFGLLPVLLDGRMSGARFLGGAAASGKRRPLIGLLAGVEMAHPTTATTIEFSARSGTQSEV